jgi:hypothetical protein
VDSNRRGKLGEHGGRREACPKGRERRGRVLDQRVQLGGFVAESTEVLDDPRVLRGQHGEELVPDAYPFEGALVVRRIADERQSLLSGIVEHICPSAIDQRPHDVVVASSLDAGQAANACPSKHSREDGLSLVVLRVPDGDSDRGLRSGDLVKSPVPQLPGPRLNGGSFGRHGDSGAYERHPELGRKRADLPHFLGGLGAKPVIDRRRT